MKKLGLVKGHFLNIQVILGGLALHKVGGKCVGATDKTENGSLWCDFLAKSLESLGNKWGGSRWINQVDLLGILIRSNWFHDRSNLVVDRKFQSHARKGREDVRKQDASIRSVISPWLEGDLDGYFRSFRALSKGGVLFAQVAVLGNVTTGLSHHPHRGALDSFTAGSSDQKRVLCSSPGSPLGGGRGFGSTEESSLAHGSSTIVGGGGERRSDSNKGNEDGTRELHLRVNDEIR
mmetsp:Transcript_21450/g.35516  ORF Transcript_21450/g.35516 Transcript_21450/m.35516 type:complete len:235 (+) Transcript_21450:634-1338(+)